MEGLTKQVQHKEHADVEHLVWLFVDPWGGVASGKNLAFDLHTGKGWGVRKVDSPLRRGEICG